MAPAHPQLDEVLYEGPGLRLRPVRPADADAAFPLVHGERRVLDWLCWQGPADLDELRSAYSTWRSGDALRGWNYHLAVEALDGDVLLGTASLRFEDHPTIGDLGYWLGVPFHGRGHGTELVALLAHLGFGPLGAGALTAEVFPGNLASERVLERSGFRLERDVDAQRAMASACGTPDPDRPRRLFLAMAGDVPATAARPQRAVARLARA